MIVIEREKPTVHSFEVITCFVRDVFGTYFIEIDNWDFPDDSYIIGRTYFSDRKKQKRAINEKTIQNILLIYRLALSGSSKYDPLRISKNITGVIKEKFRINVDYLMLFEDDTLLLRQHKIQMIYHFMSMALDRFKNRELIAFSDAGTMLGISKHKMAAIIAYYSAGTYTEVVLKNLHLSDPE